MSGDRVFVGADGFIHNVYSGDKGDAECHFLARGQA